jgi:hypothetical protein
MEKPDSKREESKRDTKDQYPFDLPIRKSKVKSIYIFRVEKNDSGQEDK